MKLRKIPLRDLQDLCTSFKELSTAGMPLLESLALIRESTTSSRLKNDLHVIGLAVKGGHLLSEALGKYPHTFDRIFTTVVHAGEKSGNLSKSFEHLVRHLQWQLEVKNRLSEALRYPFLTFGMALCLIIFLMNSVIPELSQFFKMTGGELPLMTHALMEVSRFFQENLLIMGSMVLTLLSLLILLYPLSSKFRQICDYIPLKIPFLGQILIKNSCGRFVFLLHLLLDSDIPLLEALNLAQEAVQNSWLKASFGKTRALVFEGRLLSEALSHQPVFPSFMIRMITLGERTGQLNKILLHIHHFFEQEIQHKTHLLMSMIQPFLLCVVGGLILWVALSIFVPLYDHLTVLGL